MYTYMVCTAHCNQSRIHVSVKWYYIAAMRLWGPLINQHHAENIDLNSIYLQLFQFFDYPLGSGNFLLLCKPAKIIKLVV